MITVVDYCKLVILLLVQSNLQNFHDLALLLYNTLRIILNFQHCMYYVVGDRAIAVANSPSGQVSGSGSISQAQHGSIKLDIKNTMLY